MTDRLRMDYINSLPQPFIFQFNTDKVWWPVHDLCVETGLTRIDVCGLLEVKNFCDVMQVQDGDGVIHNPDSFYSDWIDCGPTEDPTDIRAAQQDLSAQMAVEATPRSPVWERKDTKRNRA